MNIQASYKLTSLSFVQRKRPSIEERTKSWNLSRSEISQLKMFLWFSEFLLLVVPDNWLLCPSSKICWRTKQSNMTMILSLSNIQYWFPTKTLIRYKPLMRVFTLISLGLIKRTCSSGIRKIWSTNLNASHLQLAKHILSSLSQNYSTPLGLRQRRCLIGISSMPCMRSRLLATQRLSQTILFIKFET